MVKRWGDDEAIHAGDETGKACSGVNGWGFSTDESPNPGGDFTNSDDNLGFVEQMSGAGGEGFGNAYESNVSFGPGSKPNEDFGSYTSMAISAYTAKPASKQGIVKDPDSAFTENVDASTTWM